MPTGTGTAGRSSTAVTLGRRRAGRTLLHPRRSPPPPSENSREGDRTPYKAAGPPAARSGTGVARSRGRRDDAREEFCFGDFQATNAIDGACRLQVCVWKDLSSGARAIFQEFRAQTWVCVGSAQRIFPCAGLPLRPTAASVGIDLGVSRKKMGGQAFLNSGGDARRQKLASPRGGCL